MRRGKGLRNRLFPRVSNCVCWIHKNVDLVVVVEYCCAEVRGELKRLGGFHLTKKKGKKKAGEKEGKDFCQGLQDFFLVSASNKCNFLRACREPARTQGCWIRCAGISV